MESKIRFGLSEEERRFFRGEFLEFEEDSSSITSEEKESSINEGKEEIMPAPTTSVVLKSRAQKNKEKKRREAFKNPRNDTEWSIVFSFLTVSDRGLFMSNKCQEMKGFSCQYCGIETESYEAFKAHLTLLHRVTFQCYRCWDCPNLFRTVQSLLNHAFYTHMMDSLYDNHDIDLMNLNEAKQFERLSLHLRFNWYVAVEGNKKLDAPLDYICPFCVKNFGSFYAMERHVKRRSFTNGHFSKYEWFKEWQFSG